MEMYNMWNLCSSFKV